MVGPTWLSIQGGGKVGIGTSTPTHTLNVNGSLGINGLNFLEFGAGVSGKEGAAGKIGYQTFTADALDIVGAGNSFPNRKVKIWDDLIVNRNATISGATSVNGNSTLTGNVGIGTSPSSVFPLSFGAGLANTKVALYESGNIAYGLGIQSAQFRLHIGSSVDRFSFLNGPNGTEVMTIKGDGKVGIGTSAPSVPLHVLGSGAHTIGPHASFTSTGGGGNSGGFLYFFKDVSIMAQFAVHAAYFRAYSDARIKNIQGRSNGTADLETLNRIEITDYKYKDVISKGNRSHKKVIGQQVEQVFPQAVVKSVDVVPDIYRKVPTKDGWVDLATNLKKGERVRLISETQEGIHEVLEVTSDRFRTDFIPKEDAVFVFGREVDDFRVVDYEAIAMLNVSATQELARQVEALRKSEARIAALEQRASRVDSLEHEVSELKKLVTQLVKAQTEPQLT